LQYFQGQQQSDETKEMDCSSAVITMPIIQPEAQIIHKSDAMSVWAHFSSSESEDDDHSIYRKALRGSSSSSSSDSEDLHDATAVKKKIIEPLKVGEFLEIGVITNIVDQLRKFKSLHKADFLF
jgi:hypothetical protein